jgi:DNA (cytosine-5)-methyltransferase 3A
VEIRNFSQGERIYSTDGKSPCLSANSGGSTGVGNALITDDINDKYKIRKLTPIECERLQTVPDNYTEGVSNTQRYKMLGNGWTVDVIAHIFKNIEI